MTTFTDAFADLQQRRRSADYDPNAVITIDDGAVYLNRAESAILGFAQIAPNERAYIATLTPARRR